MMPAGVQDAKPGSVRAIATKDAVVTPSTSLPRVIASKTRRSSTWCGIGCCTRPRRALTWVRETPSSVGLARWPAAAGTEAWVGEKHMIRAAAYTGVPPTMRGRSAGRGTSRPAQLWRGRHEWGPLWASRVVAVVGVVSVLSAALPSARNRLHVLLELLPRFAPEVANAATVGVGLLLLAVAGGLRRRKRRAWQLATVLAGAATLLHLVKGLDV